MPGRRFSAFFFTACLCIALPVIAQPPGGTPHLPTDPIDAERTRLFVEHDRLQLEEQSLISSGKYAEALAVLERRRLLIHDVSEQFPDMKLQHDVYLAQLLQQKVALHVVLSDLTAAIRTAEQFEKITATFGRDHWMHKTAEATLDYTHRLAAAGKRTSDRLRDVDQAGHVAAAEGKAPEAIAQFEVAKEIEAEVVGIAHPIYAFRLTTLAAGYLAVQEPDKALAYLQQALAAYEKTYGAEHPDTAACMAALGSLYQSLGRAAEATDLLRRAEEIQRKLAGPVVDESQLALRPHLRSQTGHTQGVEYATLSPDGRYVLSRSMQKDSVLWHVATGKQLRTYYNPDGFIRMSSFTSDSRMIVGEGIGDGFVWDVVTGREIYRGGFEGWFVAFSTDFQHIVYQTEDYVLHRYEVISGRKTQSFDGHTSKVTMLALSDDGRRGVSQGGWKAIDGGVFSRPEVAVDDVGVRVWDVASGEQLQRLVDGDKPFSAIALSPDGVVVATATDSGLIQIWDADTGTKRRQFDGRCGTVGNLAFSFNGRRLLIGGNDGAAIVAVADGAEVVRFVGHDEKLTSTQFSADRSQVITASSDDTIRIWDASNGKELRRLEGHVRPVESATVAPDGRWLLTESLVRAPIREFCLWDLAAGRQSHRFSYPVWHDKTNPSASWLVGSAFLTDGLRVLLSGTDGGVRIVNPVDGTELRNLVGHSDQVSQAEFSVDGRRIATNGYDGTVRIWDATTGRQLLRLPVESGSRFPPGVSMKLSPDGRWIALTKDHDDGDEYSRMSLHLFDCDTGRETTCGERCIFIDSLTFSGDSRYLAARRSTRNSGGNPDPVCVVEVASGKETRKIGIGTSHSLAAISNDAKWVLSTDLDNAIYLTDVASGLEVRRFSGQLGAASSAVFSPDSRHVISASNEGAVDIWDIATAAVKCSLTSFRDGTWAVSDDEGRFDAANNGEVDGLHWVVGNEPIDLAQLKDRYYEPGLLAKVMGFNKEPLRDVAAFTDPKLHPEVKLTLPEKNGPTKDAPTLGVSLVNRGGGIGRVVVRINGKELSADARGPQPDQDAKQLELSINLQDSPLVVPGKSNKIEVFAYNAEGYLSSRGATVDYEAPGVAEAEQPHLWVIVAGTSDYRGEQIDLKFAAKDAEDFAAALTVGGKRLFGAERVHLTLLSTMQADEAKRPTRANLLRAFEAMKSAKPSDVLVIYLAGHGVNYGGQDGDFYYLTADALSADLTDPAVRAQTTISSNELTELIKQIPAAQRQVLILDTCAAGKFLDKLTEKREVESSQIRALDRVKSRTGMHVLAGCAADSVSYEASRYGQGLLTYSLLLGMRGGALQDDEYLDVVRWFDFAATRVPELARDFGGIQRPLVSSPKGNTFPIARLTGDDKAAVPLRAVRPMFLRSNFQDEDQGEDVLEVARHVDAALRDVEARGFDAPLVFVDATECPGAFRLVGRYRRNGDKIEFTLLRMFEGKAKSQNLTVAAGDAKKIADLAKQIAAEALEHGAAGSSNN